MLCRKTDIQIMRESHQHPDQRRQVVHLSKHITVNQNGGTLKSKQSCRIKPVPTASIILLSMIRIRLDMKCFGATTTKNHQTKSKES